MPAFFLEQTFRGLFGSSVKSYPDLHWQHATLDLLGFQVPKIDLLVIGCAFVSMAVLYGIVNHTKMGTAIRAVSEDKEAAALMGIDVNKGGDLHIHAGRARWPASPACFTPSSSSRFTSSWASRPA